MTTEVNKYTHVLIAKDDSDYVYRNYADDDDAINHAGYCWIHTHVIYYVYRITGVSLTLIDVVGDKK